ncbi:MAG: hypothetical protein FJ098_06550 [Deltaproteobacteria bacterium]|nr:hypothetical protein [Deltaproteobacteria bacterium]
MSDKTFTLEDLTGFDGCDGRPAYIAVDGVVYDATGSKLWRGGNHVRAHDAGRELSREIGMAPHPRDRLERLPRVGLLAAAPAAPVVPPPEPVPAFARLAHALHAHPASVHFPIALCAVAALLHAGGRILGMAALETAALINLAIGLASAPVAILSGLLDWRYHYGGRLSRLFAWKLGLSSLLLALGASALGLRLGGVGPAFDALVALHLPVVLALGFVGGRITFPAP